MPRRKIHSLKGKILSILRIASARRLTSRKLLYLPCAEGTHKKIVAPPGIIGDVSDDDFLRLRTVTGAVGVSHLRRFRRYVGRDELVESTSGAIACSGGSPTCGTALTAARLQVAERSGERSVFATS